MNENLKSYKGLCFFFLTIGLQGVLFATFFAIAHVYGGVLGGTLLIIWASISIIPVLGIITEIISISNNDFRKRTIFGLILNTLYLIFG